MTHRSGPAVADEMGMKQTSKPVFFNPSLGLAIKGMWAANFVTAVKKTAKEDPEPEKAAVPNAA